MTEKLRKAWQAQQKAADKLRNLAADSTPEIRQAAETEFNTAATALQEALDAEPNSPTPPNDGESAELRRLLDGADLGRFFEGAVEHRALDGREAELQQHFQLAGNQIPVELLQEAPEPEVRAVTTAPTDVGQNQRPILPPIFSRGDAAFLGVRMPVVPVGDVVYPVLSNRPTVGGPHRASETVAETEGTFAATVLSPARLQASFFWRRTDGARFAGMAEALRQSLASGLSEALDVQTLAQIVSDVARTAATAVDDFDSYRKRLVYDLIDGRFANREGDIRMLVGTATLTDASQLFRATTGDVSALDSLRRVSGGVQVSPHVTAPSASKQDVVVRRGSRPDAVAPIWRQISLIPDEISKADSGEIKVTAVALAAFKVVRLGGFARIQVQHA